MHTSLPDSQHQHNFFQIKIIILIPLISSSKNSTLSLPHTDYQIGFSIFNETEHSAYYNDDYYNEYYCQRLLLFLYYQYYSSLLKFSRDYLLAQFQSPPHPERSNHYFSTNHQRFILILHLFIILRYYYTYYFGYFSSFPSSSLSSQCLLLYHFKFCPPIFIFESYNLDYDHQIVYVRSLSFYSYEALVKILLECYQ